MMMYSRKCEQSRVYLIATMLQSAEVDSFVKKKKESCLVSFYPLIERSLEHFYHICQKIPSYHDIIEMVTGYS